MTANDDDSPRDLHVCGVILERKIKMRLLDLEADEEEEQNKMHSLPVKLNARRPWQQHGGRDPGNRQSSSHRGPYSFGPWTSFENTHDPQDRYTVIKFEKKEKDLPACRFDVFKSQKPNIINYMFRHYDNPGRYIEQYRNEHTCCSANRSEKRQVVYDACDQHYIQCSIKRLPLRLQISPQLNVCHNNTPRRTGSESSLTDLARNSHPSSTELGEKSTPVSLSLNQSGFKRTWVKSARHGESYVYAKGVPTTSKSLVTGKALTSELLERLQASSHKILTSGAPKAADGPLKKNIEQSVKIHAMSIHPAQIAMATTVSHAPAVTEAAPV